MLFYFEKLIILIGDISLCEIKEGAMKSLRIAAIALLMLSIIILGGCREQGTWTVDFTDVTNIDDWEIWGDYSIGTDGLWLDNESEVNAPVAFSGDFTLTLSFTLATKVDGYGYMELFFTQDWDEDFWSGVFFNDFSSNSTIEYGAYEHDNIHDLSRDLFIDEDMITSLDRNGNNVMEVVKLGNHFTVFLNDIQIFAYNQDDYYESNYYCPALYSDDWDNITNSIFYKDITVEYNGTKVTLP